MTGTVPTVDEIREAFDHDAALRAERDAALARAEAAEKDRDEAEQGHAAWREHYKTVLADRDRLLALIDGWAKDANTIHLLGWGGHEQSVCVDALVASIRAEAGVKP